MVARATASGRVTLQALELTQRDQDSVAESRVLTTRRELLDTLAEYFKLRLPPDTRFECKALADVA